MNFLDNTNEATRMLSFAAQNINTLSKLAGGKRLAPYIGLVGYKNLGDEILYEAHKKLFPAHEFTPYRRDSVVIERTAKLMGRPFCSHAILGGGTLINDGSDWLSKAEHLLDQGSKVFCIGTGAESSKFYGGKDEDNQLLKHWVKVLERFEFVGVRGPQSKAILDRAGAKDVAITGDTALALAKDRLKSTKSQGLVGITYGDVAGNPMWGNPALYREELKKAIKAIIASGSKVVLLPIWENDVPSNESLIEEIDHPDCSMVKAFDSYSKFSKMIRKCDIFVGQKLHSTIIATMNRVPSIMIEYRPKCRDFMASLELEDYIIKTSDFRLKNFLQMYDRLQKNQELVKSKAEEKILNFKHIQFEQAKKLAPILSH